MAAPQPLMRFAGAKSIHSASLTLSTGISPSTATLVVAPGNYTFREGPLELIYGAERIVLPGCIVDRVEARVGDDGQAVWAVTILDRRWRWRGLGKISGYYNARISGEIRESTKKHARDLCKLCLDALGETGYNVGMVPETIFPETDWDYATPAEALAELCDRLKMVVVLGLDNRVSLQPIYYGDPLPRLPNLASYQETLDPPETPDRIVVVGGHTRFNGWWELEPVGIETDGQTIKPIDELSYKPAGGWGGVDIERFNEVDKKYREYARRSVYKWYRIKTPLKLPLIREVVKDLELILPIDDEQSERVDLETGREYKKTAEVAGVFYNGTDGFGVWYENENNPDSGFSQAIELGGFDIDPETAVVRFVEPKFRLVIGASQAGGATRYPAQLWLHCGVSLRDKETLGWAREEFERRLTARKNNTKPRYVIRDEIVREVKEYWENNKQVVEDNRATIAKEAERVLDQIQLEYAPKTPASATYNGLIAISPSGAVPSVSWEIDDTGYGRTRASYQQEPLALPVPTRDEMRLLERQREATKQAKVARAQAEQLRRGTA